MFQASSFLCLLQVYSCTSTIIMRGARVFYLRKRAMSYHDMIAIFFFVIFLGTTFALAAVFCLDAVIEIALLGAPMLYLLVNYFHIYNYNLTYDHFSHHNNHWNGTLRMDRSVWKQGQ